MSGKRLDSQQLDNFSLIETDHRLAIDDRYRRALKALIEQFLQSRFIRAHIFLDKLNALLR